MRLSNFARDLLVQRRPLDPENLGDEVRDVTFGVMDEADIPICMSLYRANEDPHFPAGFAPRYEATLRSGRLLNLVARRNGEPVGCGGLTIGRQGVPLFCFGMVDPARQRQGIGTALFLARLSLCTPVDGWLTIRLNAVPNAVGFFRRFGVFFTQAAVCHYGLFHSRGTLHVRAAEIAACRDVLAARRIHLPDVSGGIPGADPTGPSAASPRP